MRPRERRDSGRGRSSALAAGSDHRHAPSAGGAGAKAGLGVYREDVRGDLLGRPRSTAAADAADGGADHPQMRPRPLRRGALCEHWVKNPKIYSPLHASEVECIGMGMADRARLRRQGLPRPQRATRLQVQGLYRGSEAADHPEDQTRDVQAFLPSSPSSATSRPRTALAVTISDSSGHP